MSQNEDGLRISRLDPIPQDWTQEQINNLLNTGLFPVSNQEGTHTYKVILGLLSAGKLKLSDVVSAHSSEKRYVLNDWCTNNDKLYRCTSQYAYGAFNIEDWAEQPLSVLIEYLLDSDKLFVVYSYSQEFDFDTMYNNGIIPIIVDNVSSATGAILRCSRVDNYTKTIDGNQQTGRIYTFSSIYMPNKNDSGYDVDKDSTTLVSFKYYTLGVIGGNDKWQFNSNKLGNKEYDIESVLLNQQSGAGQAPLYEATIQAGKLTIINQRSSIPTSDIQQITLTVNGAENTDKPYFAFINASKIILTSGLIIKDSNNNYFTPSDGYSGCLLGTGLDDNKTYLIEFKPNKTFSVHRVNNNGDVVDQTRFVEVSKTNGKQYFDYVNFLINRNYVPFIKTAEYGIAFYSYKTGAYNTPVFTTTTNESGSLQKITFNTNGSTYSVLTETINIIPEQEEISVDKCIFIDPVNGVNTNSGITEDEPVQTVAKAYELMTSNEFDTFCVVGTEPNDHQANPVIVEISAVPNTLPISTLKIVTKVSSFLKFLWVTFNQGSLNKKTIINANCPYVKIGYDASHNVNLTVNADGNVEIHNYTETDQTTTNVLNINAKGRVYLNCEPNEYSDYGDYPLWKDSNVYTSSVTIKANIINTWGTLNNGCHINLIATDTVYNNFELTYEDSQAIGESDSNWANVTQNYYLEAGNRVCQLESVVANTFTVKSKYYGYYDGSSLVTGSLTVKSKVDIRTTNDTYIGFINIGDITERGHVYIAGGFEQCVSDKAQFDQQGKSLNNPILQINGIISHYGITAERNLHEYAPVVFIDWKGLIEHNNAAIYAQQYKEKSLGYTTNSVLDSLYISGLDYFDNGTPVYHNYPVEIYSEGTLRRLKIYTGIDAASQKWIPVYIKCKNLVADDVQICSHDIVIDAEDSITSTQTTYFLPKPSNYYETDNGYIARYISTDTDTESSVIVRAKRNITFIPPTLSETYTCNQVFTVKAGEEFRLLNFGNFGARICAKIINIKARKLSGNFDNFCAEFHVDVDVYERIGSYFKVYGYLGANDKWAHLGTTQSTFNAKTVIMLNDTDAGKPIAGIFDFGMTSSNVTEVRNLDIHIDTIVCSFNWTTGIYCPILAQFSDYKGEISGEIGCIVNTYGNKIHKVSRWQHDLTFVVPQPSDITEGVIGTWDVSARVSLHFAEHSTPFDIFIDPDQGDDRYDGLTASTPVKTNAGLYRCLKTNFNLYINENSSYVSTNESVTLHVLSGGFNFSRGIGSAPTVDFRITGGIIDDSSLTNDKVYDIIFSELEIIPGEPNLEIKLNNLKAGVLNIHGFRNITLSDFDANGGNCDIDATMSVNITSIKNQRLNYGYLTIHAHEVQLTGNFTCLVVDADYSITINDKETIAPISSTDSCCLYGYTYLKAGNDIYLGRQSAPIGIAGYAYIEAGKKLTIYNDTLIAEAVFKAGDEIYGFVGNGHMNSMLTMETNDLSFASVSGQQLSFKGTLTSGSYPPQGSEVFIKANKISGNCAELVACSLHVDTVKLQTQLSVCGGANASYGSSSIVDIFAKYMTSAISVTFVEKFTLKCVDMSQSINIYNYCSHYYNPSLNRQMQVCLDIDYFTGYLYLPMVDSGASRDYCIKSINARIGTFYGPQLIRWGGNKSDELSSKCDVRITVNQTPSVAESIYCLYDDGPSRDLPSRATGKILILNRDIVKDEGLQAVSKQVTIPSGSTVASVTLDNDKYNIIDTINSAITELDINIPSSLTKVQECGFEFGVGADSALATVKAFVDGRQVPVKAPNAFDSTKMYQGTSLNNAIVIAEFDTYPITITNIEANNSTVSSIDIDVTGTMGSDPLPNNLEYTLSLSLDGVITNIDAVGPTTTLTGTNFTNYSNATDVAAFVTIGGKSYDIYIIKGHPLVLDGRLYKTVTIGSQTWMAENLDYKFNGLQLNNSSWSYSDKQADYYDKDEATYGVNGNKYGLLYNFVAAKYLNNNKSTLIPGWHVPTLEEWNTLINYVGGSSVAGSKLKSTTGWASGPSGSEGTDNFGFNAKPAGQGNEMNNAVAFVDITLGAHFLTSTPLSSNPNYQCNIISMYNYVAQTSVENPGNNYPFSIRLIKD